MTTAVGVDFGATGIKAALVDTANGTLLSERRRVDTPRPATTAAVRSSLLALIEDLGPTAPIGIAVPGVVHHAVVRTAANMDPAWIGQSLPDLFAGTRAESAVFLNDADAAGIAETSHGSAQGHPGLVLVVTLGTGIGVALVHNGVLIPNAEFGHLELDGQIVEHVASGSALERGGFDWEGWTALVSRYLRHLEDLLWPDLIVLGGGVTSTPDRWFPKVSTRTELRVAGHRKDAGIVGAGQAALNRFGSA